MKRKKAAGGVPPKKARTTRLTPAAARDAGSQQQGQLESFVQCPISLERMRDPVILVQSGNTYDREHLCRSLLRYPTKDPKSNVEYNVPLEYAPNVAVRALLIENHGDEAFMEFDDSNFKGEYNEAWDKLMLEKLEEYDGDDDKLPFETVRILADRGHAAAEFQLGLAYDDNSNYDDVAKNFAAAKMWYGKAADQNDLQAQNNLGWMYYNGKEGVEEPNFKLAVHWFRKVAEAGNSDAKYNLGHCYHDGKGLEQSDKMAVKWWRKAADQNHGFAQNSLGWAYYNGRGVGKDYVRAVDLWREAAMTHKNELAQINLGNAYADGIGVEKSDTTAVEWWRKAAAHNNAEAQCSLGNAYSKGKGVEKSDALAMEWWTKAAENGSSEANRFLGDAHAKLAQTFYQKAADQGEDDAKKALQSRLSSLADKE